MSGSTLRAQSFEWLPGYLAQWVGWVTIGWLLLLSLGLAARRVTGGLQQAPDAQILVLTAIGLATLSACGRLLWFADSKRLRIHRLWLIAALPTVSFVVVGAALALPNAPISAAPLTGSSLTGSSLASATWLGATGYWLIAVVSESLRALVWWKGCRLPSTASVTPEPLATSNTAAANTAASNTAASNTATINTGAGQERLEEAIGDEASDIPENALQYLVRTRTESGGQRVEGTLCAEFIRGERFRHIHVAFCPPLDRTPVVEVHQLDGAEASVKPSEVRSFGIRLDVRLARAAATDQTMQLHFVAEEPAPHAPE